MSNIVRQIPYEKDFSILLDDIDICVKNYIDLWLDGDEKRLSEPTTLFAGLLNHLYMNYFKKIKYNYLDIEYLNNLFNIYTSLCFKYNKYPMFDEFINTTGLNKMIIYSYRNNNINISGKYIYYSKSGIFIDDINDFIIKYPDEEYIKYPSSYINESVKSWESQCEMALRRGTAENNKIGSMFILKAKYGYRETAPVPAPETTRVLSTSELPKLNKKKTSPENADDAEV